MGTRGDSNSRIMRNAIGDRTSKKRGGLGVWVTLVFMAVLVVGVSLIFVNRDYLYDWYRGISYRPSREMADIRESLKLTDRGLFYFNAAKPALSQREDFNRHCRTGGDEEIAILGCYRDGDIYVYDIREKELDGIRELTAAHELLHAVWARMSETEKNELRYDLSRVLEENREYLGEELDEYNINEKQEELYVRAGTEVADLPEKLEKHFAEIFTDQDKIVSYYNGYIVVFREIETEMDNLKARMNSIDAEINNRSAEYEQRFNDYETRVRNFNVCAEAEGCFEGENEFYAKRNALTTEQIELNNMYDEISQLIDEYNDLVEEYNNDVMRGEELNRIINSVDKAERVR